MCVLVPRTRYDPCLCLCLRLYPCPCPCPCLCLRLYPCPCPCLCLRPGAGVGVSVGLRAPASASPPAPAPMPAPVPACGCACVRIWDDSIYARYQRGSFDDDTEDVGGRLTPRFKVDLSTEYKPLFKDPSSFLCVTNLMRGAPNSLHVSSCRSNNTLGLCSEMRNCHALIFY